MNPNVKSTARPRATALRKALDERIVIIDGAMGTMIQRHKLTEADWGISFEEAKFIKRSEPAKLGEVERESA